MTEPAVDTAKRDVHAEHDANQNRGNGYGPDDRYTGPQRIAAIALRPDESKAEHHQADAEHQQERDTTAESQAKLGFESPPHVF